MLWTVKLTVSGLRAIDASGLPATVGLQINPKQPAEGCCDG